MSNSSEPASAAAVEEEEEEEEEEEVGVIELARRLDEEALCPCCRNVGALKCARCQCRYYCGTDCQIKDWGEGHKVKCKALQEAHSSIDQLRRLKRVPPDGRQRLAVAISCYMDVKNPFMTHKWFLHAVVVFFTCGCTREREIPGIVQRTLDAYLIWLHKHPERFSSSEHAPVRAKVQAFLERSALGVLKRVAGPAPFKMGGLSLLDWVIKNDLAGRFRDARDDEGTTRLMEDIQYILPHSDSWLRAHLTRRLGTLKPEPELGVTLLREAAAMLQSDEMKQKVDAALLAVELSNVYLDIADAHQETLDVESVRSALDEAERLMEHAGCDAEYYRLFCARGFVALCEGRFDAATSWIVKCEQALKGHPDRDFFAPGTIMARTIIASLSGEDETGIQLASSMVEHLEGVKAQQGALALAHLLLAATRMSSEDPNDCIPTFFKALEAFDPDFLSRLKRGEFEDGYSDDCSPPKSLAHTIRAYTGFLSMDQAKVGQTLVLRPQIEARLRQLQEVQDRKHAAALEDARTRVLVQREQAAAAGGGGDAGVEEKKEGGTSRAQKRRERRRRRGAGKQGQGDGAVGGGGGNPAVGVRDGDGAESLGVGDTGGLSTELQLCTEQPEEEEVECAVCLDPLTDEEWGALRCGHRFHVLCIDAWKRTSAAQGLGHSCPYCREFM